MFSNAELSKALEQAGCECDPTDLRPDLASADALLVYVENRQNPYVEDPDYDIWVWAVRPDGIVAVDEFKNHWNVTRDAVAELARGNV